MQVQVNVVYSYVLLKYLLKSREKGVSKQNPFDLTEKCIWGSRTNFSGVRTSKVVQNMYFNAIFVVGTSGLRLKSTILKGPLLKSRVTPPRSSGELMILGCYPAQSALKKFQFRYGLWSSISNIPIYPLELHSPYPNWNSLSELNATILIWKLMFLI